jgi:hypothetical protein
MCKCVGVLPVDFELFPEADFVILLPRLCSLVGALPCFLVGAAQLRAAMNTAVEAAAIAGVIPSKEFIAQKVYEDHVKRKSDDEPTADFSSCEICMERWRRVVDSSRMRGWMALRLFAMCAHLIVRSAHRRGRSKKTTY